MHLFHYRNQEGSPCLSNRLLNTYPYQTQCLQQITNITLPLYNIDTNKVQGYLISYPSACECSVVNSGYNNSTNWFIICCYSSNTIYNYAYFITNLFLSLLNYFKIVFVNISPYFFYFNILKQNRSYIHNSTNRI